MSRRPRILVITNGYPNPHKPYAGMYLKRHVLLHRESGLDVTVLDPRDSRRGPLRTPLKHLRLALKVLKAMVLGRFDLVHAHWPMPAGLFGASLSRIRRKPFVLTSHGAYVSDFGARSRLIQFLVRRVLRSADTVIAVGHQHAEEVREAGDIAAGRIRVVDMGVWRPEAPIPKADARRKLGLAEDERIVIFIGNLYTRKGADILVRAAAALLETGARFRLIIGGEGPVEPMLRELVDALSIADDVELIGGVASDDVFIWFSAADVCVVPSRSEPLGLVALEAMACGTPVIASSVGGLRQIIQPGENGLAFPYEDHARLAALIEEILSDEALGRRLAAAGIDTARRYDMRVKAAAVRDIYLELLVPKESRQPTLG